MLRLGDKEEKKKVRGEETKFSTMIHTSREGLNYYLQKFTVRRMSLCDSRHMGKKLKVSRRDTKSREIEREKNCIPVNGGKLLLVTRADTYISSVLSGGSCLIDCLDSYSDKNHYFISCK